MSGITSGRTDPCNDNIGGLLNVYIFNFVSYRNFEIETTDNVLTTYPATTIYKYELRADGNTVNSSFNDDADGTSFSQSASLVLKGLRDNAFEINNLIHKRLGVIIETRLGHFQIMGLYNGNVVKSIKGQTGGARSDFNGYNIDIEAKEKTDLLFINDLLGAGFTIFTPFVSDNYIFQDNNNFIFQDGNNFIFN